MEECRYFHPELNIEHDNKQNFEEEKEYRGKEIEEDKSKPQQWINKIENGSNTWGDRVDREKGKIEISSEYQSKKEQKRTETDDTVNEVKSKVTEKAKERSKEEEVDVHKKAIEQEMLHKVDTMVKEAGGIEHTDEDINKEIVVVGAEQPIATYSTQKDDWRCLLKHNYN
ncbi:hypothetical protein HAX54_022315 [Datura stramonium]|uniref:Uncharacterized protein n=1 Tax=Datura stramonium TaxID=4076 RepID=A0ABS8UVY2_DATST|nr:hypothetical protein [Datura stramonium]